LFPVLFFLNLLHQKHWETRKEERRKNKEFKELRTTKKYNYAQIVRTLYDYARIIKNANYVQNYVIA